MKPALSKMSSLGLESEIRYIKLAERPSPARRAKLASLTRLLDRARKDERNTAARIRRLCR